MIASFGWGSFDLGSSLSAYSRELRNDGPALSVEFTRQFLVGSTYPRQQSFQ